MLPDYDRELLAGPLTDAYRQAMRQTTRHFQHYTSEQRADRASSHRLGPRQRLAVGEYFYTHPDVPGRSFPRRSRAARSAVLATTWRALRDPFTCTGCSTRIVYCSGDAEQTLDGPAEAVPVLQPAPYRRRLGRPAGRCVRRRGPRPHRRGHDRRHLPEGLTCPAAHYPIGASGGGAYRCTSTSTTGGSVSSVARVRCTCARCPAWCCAWNAAARAERPARGVGIDDERQR